MKIAEGYRPALSTLSMMADRGPDRSAPSRSTSPTSHYVGEADNEAETADRGEHSVKTTYGRRMERARRSAILSDSVSQLNGGLADSVEDRRPSPRTSRSSRTAMPGEDGRRSGDARERPRYRPRRRAGLRHGRWGRRVNFGNNIVALAANSGAEYIADDLQLLRRVDGSRMDPIQQVAINTVTSEGVVYTADGQQPERQRLPIRSSGRSVTATVTGIGSGTFQNFDRHRCKTVATKLGIFVTDADDFRPWSSTNRLPQRPERA